MSLRIILALVLATVLPSKDVNKGVMSQFYYLSMAVLCSVGHLANRQEFLYCR